MARGHGQTDRSSKASSGKSLCYILNTAT